MAGGIDEAGASLLEFMIPMVKLNPESANNTRGRRVREIQMRWEIA